MPEHDRLVELGFAEPRPFLARRKNLNGHVLPSPTTAPHLAVAAFACDRDDGELKTYFIFRDPKQSASIICIYMVITSTRQKEILNELLNGIPYKSKDPLTNALL